MPHFPVRFPFGRRSRAEVLPNAKWAVRTIAEALKLGLETENFKQVAWIVGMERAERSFRMTFKLSPTCESQSVKDPEEFKRFVNKLWACERREIDRGRSELQTMARKAMAHKYDRWDPTLYKKMTTFGAVDSDSDARKAAKWLSYKSDTYKKELNDAQRGDYLGAVEAGITKAAKHSLWDERFLIPIRKACSPSGLFENERGVNFEQEGKYPSGPSGEYLREQLFFFMRGIPKPSRQGDDGWRGIALFLLGALLQAHSFTDGNGRTARAAYAAALLQGGLAFAAPKWDFETKLSRMPIM